MWLDEEVGNDEEKPGWHWTEVLSPFPIYDTDGKPTGRRVWYRRVGKTTDGQTLWQARETEDLPPRAAERFGGETWE